MARPHHLLRHAVARIADIAAGVTEQMRVRLSVQRTFGQRRLHRIVPLLLRKQILRGATSQKLIQQILRNRQVKLPSGPTSSPQTQNF